MKFLAFILFFHALLIPTVFAETSDVFMVNNLKLKVIIKNNDVKVYQSPDTKSEVTQNVKLFEFYYVLKQGDQKIKDQFYWVSKSPLATDAIGYVHINDAQEWEHRELIRFAPSSGRELATIYSDRSYEGEDKTGKFCLEVALRDNKRDPNKMCSATFQEPTATNELRQRILLPILNSTHLKINPTQRKQLYEVAFLTSAGVESEKERDQTSDIDKTKLADSHHNLDLIFLLDTTRSMQPTIDSTLEVIQSAANTVFNNPKHKNRVRLGLVGYRDRPEIGEDSASLEYTTKIIQPLTNDIEKFQRNLSYTKASLASSGDHPEALLDGVAKALSDEIMWSNEGSRLVLIIGDAPGHEEPGDKNPFEYTIKKLVKIAREKRVFFGALQITGNLGHDKVHQEQLIRFINGTSQALDSSTRINVFQSKDPRKDKAKFINNAMSFITAVSNYSIQLGLLAHYCTKYPNECNECRANPTECEKKLLEEGSPGVMPMVRTPNSGTTSGSPNAVDQRLVPFLMERLDVAGLTVKSTSSGFTTGWISTHGFDMKETIIPHALVTRRELNALIGMLYSISGINSKSSKEIEAVMKETLQVLIGDKDWNEGETLEDYIKRASGLPIRSKLIRFTADDVKSWTEKYINELIAEVESKRKTLQDWEANPDNWIKMTTSHEVTYIPIGILP